MRKLRVILITGLSGSGKTTLARKLAHRYGVALLAKDIIKEPLLDVIGLDTPAQSRKLSDASFAVLFALARELAAAHVSPVQCVRTQPSGEGSSRSLSGSGAATVGASEVRPASGHDPNPLSFILEGNFRAGEHEPSLRPLLTTCDLAQVLCRVSESERIARLGARAHDAGRHRGHQDADLARQSNPATGRFLDVPGVRWVLDPSGDASSGAEKSAGRSAVETDGAAILTEPALLEALDRWITASLAR